MHGRAARTFRPDFDRLEAKPLMSAVMAKALAASPGVDPSAADSAITAATPSTRAFKYVLSRITNPTPTNAQLNPPFKQVRVQVVTPKPGQLYNLNFVSVRNSTNQTFDAGSGFQVKLSRGSTIVPVLTGDQQWKPGEVFVFYILTKKFYPFSPQVSAGYAFNLGGTRGVAIPGPSGNFFRVKYDPATIKKVVNQVVAFGPGSKGRELGLPDTALWEFTAKRVDKPAPRKG